MRTLTRIAAATSVIAALTFSALGATAAPGVSTAEFTRQVCVAVAIADHSGKAPSAALNAAIQTYRSSPSAATAVGVRDALIGATQNIEQQISGMLAAIQRAGAPTKAVAFVDALTAELEASRTAAQQLVQHATAIDTTSSAAFATGVQQVVTETKAVSKETRAAAKNNPAFQNAARPLRPLVHYMTTTADNCKMT